MVLLLATAGTIAALRSGDDQPPAAQQQVSTGQAANADEGVPITEQPEPTFAEPEPTPTQIETTEAPPTTEVATVDPEQAAAAQLEQIWSEDSGQVSFQGQYAAQIASKYPGIYDKLQTTAGGSHTFNATDILDEHRTLRDAHTSAEHPIVLVKSTDYSKRQTVDGHFLWVTFAIGSFPNAAAVHSWCDAQFASLSAAQRENQCAVRRLNPGQ
ncbi:hypothetical protein AB0J83_41215 [Actinoplanes sp. NPDC049596]|uniref:hypothetical protein n=1 Tax=Actinoplanes sp. NPDC049596 TaxID=3154625 RepID=UPI003428E1BC